MLAQSWAGAAGAGLDFDVAVGAVLRAVEHALEFKLFNVAGVALDFGGDALGAVLVAFINGHAEELLGVVNARREALEAADEVFKELLLLAYFLRMLGIVPELRILDFPVDFFKPPLLAVDVKDTP